MCFPSLLGTLAHDGRDGFLFQKLCFFDYSTCVSILGGLPASLRSNRDSDESERDRAQNRERDHKNENHGSMPDEAAPTSKPPPLKMSRERSSHFDATVGALTCQ